MTICRECGADFDSAPVNADIENELILFLRGEIDATVDVGSRRGLRRISNGEAVVRASCPNCDRSVHLTAGEILHPPDKV